MAVNEPIDPRVRLAISQWPDDAITGKPYKPTTQGKNERFHQTLFRYLDKQSLAETLDQLQAQVDAFDHIDNTERPHQGLPGRVTPLTAWEATPKAEAPRPQPDRPLFDRPEPRQQPAPPVSMDLPAGTHIRTVTTAGTISLDFSFIFFIHNSSFIIFFFLPITTRLSSSTSKSSPSTPDPHPASPTSATADPAAHAPKQKNCHRSPDTPNVTHVLTQNCHQCPETSQVTFRVGYSRTIASRAVATGKCVFSQAGTTSGVL